jgi:hypothetical protein
MIELPEPFEIIAQSELDIGVYTSDKGLITLIEDEFSYHVRPESEDQFFHPKVSKVELEKRKIKRYYEAISVDLSYNPTVELGMRVELRMKKTWYQTKSKDSTTRVFVYVRKSLFDSEKIKPEKSRKYTIPVKDFLECVNDFRGIET